MPATLAPSRDKEGQARAKQSKPASAAAGQGGKAEDQVAKRVPKALTADQDLKKLVTLISKMMANCTQQLRDVLSVVMDNLVGPSESGVADAAREQGLTYNSRVQSRGHGLGSPHVWIYGGVLEWLVKNIDKEETPDPEIAALEEHLRAYGELDPEAKAQECKFFKLTKTFRTENCRITLALHGKAAEVRPIVIKQLQKHGYDLKSGRAPASYMERDLQQWIEAMDPK